MSLGRKAASGAAWNVVTGLGGRGVGLIATLALTRFLDPTEFGEVSVAVVTVLLAARFATTGLGPFVIANRSPPAEVFQAFTLHIVLVGTAALMVVAARGPLSETFGSPAAAQYIPGLALAIFIMQLAHIPSAIMMRGLRFRFIATSRAAGEVAYAVVSVALAAFIGAAAIVVGNIARAALVATVVISGSDRREWLHPVRLHLATIRRMLRFGLPLSASGASGDLAAWGDKLLVSYLHGPGVMAQYKIADSLASTPTSNVVDYMVDVLLPSFSQMETEEKRLLLPRTAALMSLVLFPLAVGLAAVAPTVVRTLLDPRWAGVAPMLALLCAMNLPHPIGWVVTTFLASEKRTIPIMGVSVARLIFVFGAILTLGRAGPVWLCAGIAAAYLVYGVVTAVVGWRVGGLSATALLSATARPLLASLLMGAAVLAFRTTITSSMTGWIALPLEIGVGGLAYVGLVFLVARSTTLELIRLTKAVIASRGAA